MSRIPRISLDKLIKIKHGFAFKSDFFANSGLYIVLTPGNFKEEGGFRLTENIKYYTGDFPLDYLLEKEDLLLAMTEQAPGLLGSSILIPESDKYLHNQRLGLVEIKDDSCVHKKYLYHCFNLGEFRKFISKTSAGTKVKHTSPEKLCKALIYLPPIAEQKRIAEILEVWDGAIAIVEQLITAKQKLKNALLHRMLEDAFELPETEKVKLREIASVKTGPFGSLLHESDYKEFGTPIITVEHLSENGILHKGLPLVSDEDKTRLKSYILKEGDVVFSRVGSVDRSSVVSCLEDGWLFSGRLLRVRPNPKKVCFQYLNYYFHQPRFRHTIRSMAVGGTMPCLNTQILGGIQLTLPPIHIQQKIAAILATCDLDIQNYVSLLDRYKQQKKGLMQKLLTGEWRVPVEEVAA